MNQMYIKGMLATRALRAQQVEDVIGQADILANLNELVLVLRLDVATCVI
jgi:hypothetical protein